MAYFFAGCLQLPRNCNWFTLLAVLVYSLSLVATAGAISPALHEHYLLSIAVPRSSRPVISVHVRHSCIVSGPHSHLIVEARFPNSLVMLPRTRACCAVISAVIDDYGVSRLAPASFVCMSFQHPLVSVSLPLPLEVCRPSFKPELPGWKRWRRKRSWPIVSIQYTCTEVTCALVLLMSAVCWHRNAPQALQPSATFTAWPLALCERCVPLTLLLQPASTRAPSPSSMTFVDGINRRPKGHFITLRDGGTLTQGAHK